MTPDGDAQGLHVGIGHQEALRGRGSNGRRRGDEVGQAAHGLLQPVDGVTLDVGQLGVGDVPPEQHREVWSLEEK